MEPQEAESARIDKLPEMVSKRRLVISEKRSRKRISQPLGESSVVQRHELSGYDVME